jgi:hypothetical protein
MNMRLPQVTNRTLGIVIVVAAVVVVSAIIIKKRLSTPTPLPPTFVLGADAPANPSAQPAGPKDVATTVLELFNPSDKALTHQLNETAITQQIEQLMATSFVLANCKLITSDDYKRTYQAAIVYAQQNNLAPDQKSATNKVLAITKSAGASYALIYSRTKCDDAKLATITEQLKTWQNAYLPNDSRTAGLDPD